MNRPRFLTLQRILKIHDASLAEHGGTAGIRDHGLIDSARASAENTFHYAGGDLFEIAATYAFHIAESQAFLDGNKRTAITSAIMFLKLNAVEIIPDEDALYNAMIAIAKKRLDKKGLAEIFKKLATSK
ncbi:MAG: type II toxin-antitoxin system death-on-curing family toxin [Limisphaerales bacterium]